MENFINQIREKKLPAHLTDLLMAETENKNITAMWLHRPAHQNGLLLTILCKDKLLLQQTFDYLFIGDSFEQDRVLISVLDDADLEQHREDRYVFFQRYARKEDQIYGEEKNYGRFTIVDLELRSLRKRYLKGEQLLSKYTEELIADGQVGATLFYLKNIQHDLEFLEYMRFGRPFEGFALAERLRYMEAFIPEVRKFFVKEGCHFYLLRQIENEEIVEYMEAYQDDLCKIKEEMKNTVLRDMQAKLPEKTPLHPPVSHALLKNKAVKKVLRPLLQLAYLEEVYSFHEITTIEKELQHRHYYLLALVSEESEKDFDTAVDKINKAQFPDLKFTIICHTRLWVQENIYECQDFFKNLMQVDNRIYTNGFHPEIHWNSRHTTDCGDLSFYRLRAKNIFKEHLKTACRDQAATVALIPYWLNNYLVQLLKNRIYQTFGYLPETDHLQTLWDLFIFSAEPGRYWSDLLHTISFDFITYLHEHRQQKVPVLHLNYAEKKKLFSLLQHLK